MHCTGRWANLKRKAQREITPLIHSPRQRCEHGQLPQPTACSTALLPVAAAEPHGHALLQRSARHRACWRGGEGERALWAGVLLTLRGEGEGGGGVMKWPATDEDRKSKTGTGATTLAQPAAGIGRRNTAADGDWSAGACRFGSSAPTRASRTADCMSGEARQQRRRRCWLPDGGGSQMRTVSQRTVSQRESRVETRLSAGGRRAGGD